MPKAKDRRLLGSMSKLLFEWLTVAVAAMMALVIAYSFSVDHMAETQARWQEQARSLMGPAINFACTGHFGPIRASADSTPADGMALQEISKFLWFRKLHYSCESFPRHVLPTSFFDDIGAANVEQPLYLTMLYAVVWRLFGVEWTATNYVVAATVSLSFLVVYVCARAFVPAILSAALALFFVSSPFFIEFTLSPRDGLKHPFALAICALLVGVGTAVCRPVRFIAVAAGVGMLIGIGYGFRSDIYLFLFPAPAIVAVLGRIDLSVYKLAGTRRFGADLGLRAVAACVLIGSFAIGGGMPLFNDRYFQAGRGDIGYHPMAMGLLGFSRNDLFQANGFSEGMYMFRGPYTDLAVGLRIMEYAARRHSEEVQFAQDRYWTYSKRYYLDVVSLIPADLVAGAIGGFVNLMTVPVSLAERQSQFEFHARPWTFSYRMAQGTAFSRLVAWLDHSYGVLSHANIGITFAANIFVSFVFLSLLCHRFGIRAAVAALLLLGVVIAVTSLKFEPRHMAYLFVFPLLAWGTSIWLITRSITLLLNLRSAEGGDNYLFARIKTTASAVGTVVIVIAVVSSLTLAVLLTTRSYQARVLRSMMEDWVQRPRIPTQTETVEVRPGVTLIRITSPMPLTSGEKRQADAPIRPRPDMGVVAVEIDGDRCGGRRIVVMAMGAASWPDTAFLQYEGFTTSGRPVDEVGFFPVFYFLINTVTMYFVGIEVETQDVPCIKTVGFVNRFTKEDVLFDFMIPQDPSNNVYPSDLFQHVYIPGIGYL
jgi:hypothetical protein